MTTDRTYEFDDFETYCSVLIEIEKFKKYFLGRMSDKLKAASLSSVRSAIDEELDKESDSGKVSRKRGISERLLKEYEQYLYS